jgi:hypothetical protein
MTLSRVGLLISLAVPIDALAKFAPARRGKNQRLGLSAQPA